MVRVSSLPLGPLGAAYTLCFLLPHLLLLSQTLSLPLNPPALLHSTSCSYQVHFCLSTWECAFPLSGILTPSEKPSLTTSTVNPFLLSFYLTLLYFLHSTHGMYYIFVTLRDHLWKSRCLFCSSSLECKSHKTRDLIPLRYSFPKTLLNKLWHNIKMGVFCLRCSRSLKSWGVTSKCALH